MAIEALEVRERGLEGGIQVGTSAKRAWWLISDVLRPARP